MYLVQLTKKTNRLISKGMCVLNPIRPGLFGAPQAWGGIFSSPLPNVCSRSDNDLKLCGKIVYHEKIPKKNFRVDDVIIFDDVSIFIDFVCCQLLVIF